MLKTRILPLLSALALLLTAGCGAPAPAESGAESEVTLYDCGGLQATIPAEYAELLTVVVPETTEEFLWGEPLLDVYETASQEAFAADNGAASDGGVHEGVGFLFGIARLSPAAYEQHLMNDYGGVRPFAKDGEGNYYAMTTATDVQFYRSGNEIDTGSEDWKTWESLGTLGDVVRADFLERNGLTAYSDSEFTSREFTYDGKHAYVKYFTYHSFDGDDRIWNTLVLSQPAAQGEGGVWCVERFYDEFGVVYYNFPDVAVPAAAYYAELQARCDAGELPGLLTPLGAAEDFAKNSAWNYDDAAAAADSFQQIDAPDTDYFAVNAAIDSDLRGIQRGDLAFSDPADPAVLSFLEHLAAFTPDTWGVLGRRNYGSDWWTPLKEGIAAAAVGPEQASRDTAVMRLYLTVPGEPYAADLAAVLQNQLAADIAAFGEAKSSFSPQEQLTIQAAAE